MSKSIITIHATMTGPAANITKREIDKRDREYGFAMIGCHWVILRDGTVEKGRPETQASVYDQLSVAKDAVSVLLVGGTDDAGSPTDNFTDDQKDALVTTIKDITHRNPQASYVKSCTPALGQEMLSRLLVRPRD